MNHFEQLCILKTDATRARNTIHYFAKCDDETYKFISSHVAKVECIDLVIKYLEQKCSLQFKPPAGVGNGRFFFIVHAHKIRYNN